MRTLRIVIVTLMMAGAMFVNGCTLIGASLKTSGYGFTVEGSVAGFSTTAGFELPIPEKEEETE